MNLHDNLQDFFLLALGTTTGVVAMSYEEIDLISGIILKWVSIVSFVIVAVINLKKLFTPKNKKNDNV